MEMDYTKIVKEFEPISVGMKEMIKKNNRKCIYIQDSTKPHIIFGEVSVINDFSYKIKKLNEKDQEEVLSFHNLEKVFINNKRAQP